MFSNSLRVIFKLQTLRFILLVIINSARRVGCQKATQENKIQKKKKKGTTVVFFQLSKSNQQFPLLDDNMASYSGFEMIPSDLIPLKEMTSTC